MYRKLQVIYMFIILFIQILCRQIYVQSMYNLCTINVQSMYKSIFKSVR